MSATVDERGVVERVRKGDLEAYRLLVDAYTPRLIGYFSSRISDPGLVQDLVQETFIAAYQHLGTFSGRSRYSTWLTGIGRNKLLTHLRDVARCREKEDAVRAELLIRLTPDMDAVHVNESPRYLGALQRCLGRLPPHIREVVDRRYVQNDTVRAIGDRLGRSEDAVRAILSRARNALKLCLSEASSE